MDGPDEPVPMSVHMLLVGQIALAHICARDICPYACALVRSKVTSGVGWGPPTALPGVLLGQQ